MQSPSDHGLPVVRRASALEPRAVLDGTPTRTSLLPVSARLLWRVLRVPTRPYPRHAGSASLCVAAAAGPGLQPLCSSGVDSASPGPAIGARVGPGHSAAEFLSAARVVRGLWERSASLLPSAESFLPRRGALWSATVLRRDLPGIPEPAVLPHDVAAVLAESDDSTFAAVPAIHGVNPLSHVMTSEFRGSAQPRLRSNDWP
jgi:hypothetical protein